MILACTACLTPVQASAPAATPPVVTIAQPTTHSSPLRYYTIAELEATGQLYRSGVDDHDMPEQEAPWALRDAVYAGTAPTMLAAPTVVGRLTRPMVWPTTVSGMPAPRFGWTRHVTVPLGALRPAG